MDKLLFLTERWEDQRTVKNLMGKSVVMPPQNTVPWPEPYETLDNEHSYTPVKTAAEI